ncbi:hypothetical protein BGZ65_006520 [Modicella reniformis]|uniref:Uncharacterized protein n=1 Tax=Modicella reniformis TaxID=1440133 RepID=A0A9P6JN46_9FUNG|nr:hypothetical protein BGZ65_006520 [Modicella reniformis]
MSTPSTDGYLAYLMNVFNEAPVITVARTWDKLRQYFGDNKREDHTLFEDMNDIDVLATTFKDAPEMDASDVTTFWTSMPSPPLPIAMSAGTSSSAQSISTSSSRVRTTSVSNSSGSGNSNPSLGQIATMKNLFKDNFKRFDGNAWLLQSGVVVDDVMREKIEILDYESALHSFVIEDVEELLEFFENSNDKEEIRRMMVKPDGEGLPALSAAERDFLEQYNLPPKELIEFVATHGWRNVGDSLQNKPSDEFQDIAHACITHVLSAYQEHDFILPSDSSESTLEYKLGEVASEASGGHTVDGMVVIVSRTLELLHMEASRKYGGTYSTKCLHDTKKLFKVMKDAHDTIRKKTAQNVRDKVVTFGLHISGPSATIFSLKQRPGRFYQAIEETKMPFPPYWKDSDTGTIITIFMRVLRLRKALLAMEASVTRWTALSSDREPGDHDDCRALTMTTPQLLPAASAAFVEDILPLAI